MCWGRWSNRSRSGGSHRPARSRLRRRFFGGAFGFRRALGVCYTLQVVLNFFRDIGGNRTGVRFLFGNAETGQ